MGSSVVTVGAAREHASQFDDATLGIEIVEFGRGRLALDGLDDVDLMVCARSDLRKMGHDQHLMFRADTSQCLPDGERSLATDTGIDLIEDHGFGGAADNQLQGEHDA